MQTLTLGDLPYEILSDIVMSTRSFRDIVILHTSCKHVGKSLVAMGRACDVARLAADLTAAQERERRSEHERHVLMYSAEWGHDIIMREDYGEVPYHYRDSAVNALRERFEQDFNELYDIPGWPEWVPPRLARFYCDSVLIDSNGMNSGSCVAYFDVYFEYAKSLCSLFDLRPDEIRQMCPSVYFEM